MHLGIVGINYFPGPQVCRTTLVTRCNTHKTDILTNLETGPTISSFIYSGVDEPLCINNIGTMYKWLKIVKPSMLLIGRISVATSYRLVLSVLRHPTYWSAFLFLQDDKMVYFESENPWLLRRVVELERRPGVESCWTVNRWVNLRYWWREYTRRQNMDSMTK